MNSLLGNRCPRLGLLIATLLLASCTENKQTVQQGDDDGGVIAPGSRKPVLGGKLGAAVAAAEAASSRPAPASSGGPPESGFFQPGAADQVFAKNAPAKVEVIDSGAAPKFTLALTATGEQRENAIVSISLGGGNGLLVDYTLDIKPEDTKADKGDKADNKADAGPPAGRRLVATVAQANSGPNSPRDLADQYAKLKGTQVKYTLAPNGVVSDVAFTLAKDADPALGAGVRALAEAIAQMTTPLPTVPVGAGAYWMTTDRVSTYLGVEVVRYRVFRVEKIQQDKVTFGVEVRQYATSNEVDLGSLGNDQKLTMDRFESSGKQKLEWGPSTYLPPSGETAVRMQVVAQVQGKAASPGAGRAVLQTELQARLTGAQGKADKADKKK